MKDKSISNCLNLCLVAFAIYWLGVWMGYRVAMKENNEQRTEIKQ